MKTLHAYDLPISVQLDFASGEFTPCPEKVERRLSDLADLFADRRAVDETLAAGDRLIYEVRYYPFITSRSDMALGTTVIFPGAVGGEYHMTKGHFHTRTNQPELYFCVQGEGLVQMESREGDYHTAWWKPGAITHIPPQYAHRVVNTGSQPLIFLSSFHVAAGHDYNTIAQRGFQKIVVERGARPVEIANPRRPV